MRRCLLPLILLTACAQPHTVSPHATPQEIQAEAAMHEEYVKNERAKGLVHVIEDSRPVTKRLQGVAARIAPAAVDLCREMKTASDPRDCAFDIFIKTGRGKNALNAYADGQSIYITRNMVRFTRDDNELALIIAHEMAHNMMRHSSAQRQNSYVGLILGAMMEGVMAKNGYGAGGDDYASAGMQSGAAAYSPDFEQEADYIGLYLVARAGYDYRNVADLWRRMSLENPEAIYVRTTHPSNPERYVVMRKDINEIDSKMKLGMPLQPELAGQQYSGQY